MVGDCWSEKSGSVIFLFYFLQFLNVNVATFFASIDSLSFNDSFVYISLERELVPDVPDIVSSFVKVSELPLIFSEVNVN